jgi:hypothetical protein
MCRHVCCPKPRCAAKGCYATPTRDYTLTTGNSLKVSYHLCEFHAGYTEGASGR